MSVNSPYLGRELPGRVVATIHGGVPTVLDGCCATPRRWPVDRLPIAIVIIVRCWSSLFLLLARGWRARRRAQAVARRAASRPPTSAPISLTDDLLYVATTRADAPLDRITIAGLGFRARAVVSVAATGVMLDLAGRGRRLHPDMPRSAASGAPPGPSTASSTPTASYLRPLGRCGTTEIDSYLRSTDPDRLVAALTPLAPVLRGGTS